MRSVPGPALVLHFASVLSVIVGAGTQAAAVPADDAAQEFLSALPGDWQGSAVHTPAGPFSYDIRFAADDAGCASGVALPGGVHHRWEFCRAEAGLDLRFLSDFGGNDTPLLLQLHGVDAGVLVFHSQSHGFLKVRTQLADDCLRLQVLHNDRLHVEIHLRRPAPPGNGIETPVCPWPMPVSPPP